MIGGAKGIGIGIDFGIPNQYCRATNKPYIEKDVLDSLRVVASAYGKTNNYSDRAIVKNLVDPDNPFVISNAAYDKMSSYGGYEFAKFDNTLDWYNTEGNDSVVVVSRNGHSITLKRLTGPNFWYFQNSTFRGLISNVIPFKVNSNKNISVIWEVHGLSISEGKDKSVRVQELVLNPNEDNYTNLKTLNEEELAQIDISTNSLYYLLWFDLSTLAVDEEVTIEMLPLFEGAFVTDGIDDLITSTKTVQEMLGGSNEITVVSMIHQVKDSSNNVSFTNYIRGSANGYFRNIVNNYDKTGIYGYTSSDLIGLSVVNNILGDKNDYTANGDNRDSIINGNFSVQGYSYNDGNNTGDFSSVAWYWTIIANKVLTTDQINQVIAYFNLDKTLKPDILCNTIKQGITNENHAEFGDKLIDFSGNGRDIQLNNIAWKGDSGIGKYSADFESFDWAVNISQKQHNKATISLNSRLCNHTAIEVDEMKVNIIGNITELIYWYIANPDDTTRSEIRLTSGINTLPKSYAKDDGQTYNIGFAYISGDSEITIEQIPSHAGALCLDGVNDFGKVTGMPIYKDYTFIIEREFLNETFPNQVCLVSKSKVASEIENGGAFIVDNISVNAIINPYSFYKTTSLPNLNTFDKQIVFQSKYKYLDKDIAAGTATDSDTLWLGTFRDNDSRFANIAIYSLMSFPYSMSKFLIERQLKKHKLGTLYPDMVEFRPIIKANDNYKIFYTAMLPLTGDIWERINIGDYVPVGRRVAIQLSFDNEASELVSAISSQLGNISITKNSNNKGYTIFGDILKNKSPQKINITIDEYIRYEDIVQPYPALLRFNDENGNEVSWGGKFRVGSTITRIGSAADSNLLPNIYNIFGLLLNDNQVTSSKVIVEKTMVFKAKSAYIFDNNEPKCILSPRLLRIPNSSYKILGYIPDISGHGNHGIIHNSAYAEGSGVNEDGSYQFDGVDDFVTIPTVSGGGKQVFMKINNNDNRFNRMLYDQRSPASGPNSLRTDFAIYSTNSANDTPIAYQSRLEGNTYIDGILNTNITCEDLLGILHNITITCNIVFPNNGAVPYIGVGGINKDLYTKMSLYDFMLFDDISTDDKIKELNEYVGIEAKVELPPYYWDAYGKSNLDEDRDSIKQRGVAVGDYDLTNTNFAYDKMSGYGGYSFKSFNDSKDWNIRGDGTGVEIVSRDGYSITIKKLIQNLDWQISNNEYRYPTILDKELPFKCISNKKVGLIWQLKYKTEGATSDTNVTLINQQLTPNVPLEINLPYKTQDELTELGAVSTSVYYLLYFSNTTLEIGEEYTVEMLPLYPNGLVYDGVEDFSDNKNVPLIDDFTVIAKRTWLEENTSDKPFIIKGDTLYPDGNKNAFLFEYGKLSTYSFGQNNKYDESVVPSLISWATPTSYNGTTSLVRGSAIDTVGIDIAHATKIVLYKLILYPKTIPLLQINFLKNLMEKDEIIDLTNPIFIQ